MIDILTPIIGFLSYYGVQGNFAGVLMIILLKLYPKIKAEPSTTIQCIRWLMVAYSCVNILYIVLQLIPLTKQTNSYYLFFNRAIGEYWWAYWMIILFNTIVPLILINKRIGNQLPALLCVSILMNCGRIFEYAVIYFTSLYNEFLPATWGISFQYTTEIAIAMKGLCIWTVALVLEYGVRSLRKMSY